MFKAYECDVVHAEMDADGLVPEALRQAIAATRAAGKTIKFLYTIPNFHNPAGVTLSAARRQEVLEICRAEDILILEDNPYGLLGFDGDPLPALRAAESEGVIYLGSFSKTFAPGFRVGWVLAPHAVREKLVLAQESATLCPPQFSQMAVSAYLSQHDWQGQIKQFREMYRERRDAMVGALDDLMPAACRWNVPDGGFYVWLTLPAGRQRQGDAPACGHRAGRVRAGHRVLRRRLRLRVAAAVVLLPHPGADPGGRPAARRRPGGRDGAARDVRRQQPGARPRRGRRLRRAELRPDLTGSHAVRDLTYPPIVVAAKTGFRLLGQRFELTGTEHVPREGGVLLAYNHIGYVDFVYGGLAANPSGRLVRFMAKREIFAHRIGGPVMRSMHHIEVDRGAGETSFSHGGGVPARRRGGRHLPGGHDLPGDAAQGVQDRCRPDCGRGGRPAGAGRSLWGTQRMMTKDHPKDFSRGKTIAIRVGEPLHPTGADPVAETAELHAVMTDLLDASIRGYPADRAAAGLLVAAGVVRRRRAHPGGRPPSWMRARSVAAPSKRANKST